MSDFTAKMHQIRFRLGLRPDPAGGAYNALPDPLAGGLTAPPQKPHSRPGLSGLDIWLFGP